MQMKVLIVCSGNSGKISPFVQEQANALQKLKVEIDFFQIKGKGPLGYLRNLKRLNAKINKTRYQLINAHYGLSGLFANLQRKLPVVTTLHGSDIHSRYVKPFSLLAKRMSSQSIFVSKYMAEIAGERSPVIIPCGVDFDVFYPIDKDEARRRLNMDLNKKYVLFSSAFNKPVKNYNLAKEAMSLLETKEVELLELNGYTRQQVALLMNAVDVALLTSHSEGSPQFVKEAMASNCPVVSVNVGDVKDIIKDTQGCYLCFHDAKQIAVSLEKALNTQRRTNGRENVTHLRSNIIAERVRKVYESVLI
jgi:glycosyltransferase involved in cell wall biosynthesis